MKDLNGICNVYYRKQGNEIAQSSTKKWKQKHIKTTVFATISSARGVQDFFGFFDQES
jgi:hypothetical protein